MTGKYLLDTNIVIAALSSDTGVLQRIEDAARYYGQIKELLRQKGKPIPENDIWIAASAIQYALTLATRDLHFDSVDGLQLSRW